MHPRNRRPLAPEAAIRRVAVRASKAMDAPPLRPSAPVVAEEANDPQRTGGSVLLADSVPATSGFTTRRAMAAHRCA
eukprot:scaffold196669_cov28-Tisochrysis_lutea.AAC.6